ncbi:MAG: DUF2007 domain-containing protein [Planctomycetota bacterium]
MIEFLDQKNSEQSENSNLIRLYTTSNQIQARLLSERLKEQGISASVVGEYIETGQPLPSCIEILVPQSRAVEAEKFLKKWNIRTELTESTAPFSVFTAAAFLFVSVSAVAFLAVTQKELEIWIPWTFLGVISSIASFWFFREFSSLPKLQSRTQNKDGKGGSRGRET